MAFKERVIHIDEIDENEGISHILFIDENGQEGYDSLEKAINDNKPINEGDLHLTLTSVIVTTDNLKSIQENITAFKNKWWPPSGMYTYRDKYQKVTLHSREMRRKEGPFHSSVLDTDQFKNGVYQLISSLPIKIRSAHIDKLKMIQKYKFREDAYSLGMSFILERLVKFDTRHDSKIILIFESRSDEKDIKMIKAINELLKSGTYYVSSEVFAEKIVGIYFNPKRPQNDDSKSYFGLEIADICSYPIHKFQKNGTKDEFYSLILSKLCFCGLKKFP